MQDNSKFDELLASYLANELNQEDEAFVLEWINFSQDHREYFEKLSNVWKLTHANYASNSLNIDAEWNRFEGRINSSQEKASFFREVDNIAGQVVQNERPGKKSVINKLTFAAATVAAFILIILYAPGWLKSETDVKVITKSGDQKPVAPVAIVVNERNFSGKVRRITLNDGSEIELADKSELSYSEPFVGNRRDVILKGRAHFRVAKNKAMPFTVFTGDISTTVLGTTFTVTAFEDADNISVRLYEGSVVVTPQILFTKKPVDHYYLKPGQEFLYNKLTSLARITRFTHTYANTGRLKNSAKDFEQPDLPVIPSTDKSSWFMFNNQALDRVFKQLEKMYDVKITFSQKDVAHKYFIGKFEKSDTIESVLRQIAAVNNLQVVKQDQRFIIRKEAIRKE